MNTINIRRFLILLNLPNRFDEAQLKQAYHDHAQVWHPDKHGHNPRLRDKAESIFKEINAAYEYFRANMRAGYYEFHETQSSHQANSSEPRPEMDEMLRSVEKELKRQFDTQIHSLTKKYEDEVAGIKHKHDDYIRRLSTSLDGAKAELSKEKAKAEKLQKIVSHSVFSFHAVRTFIFNIIIRPVVATAHICADFLRQSRALLLQLVEKHMPDKFDRVLILSTIGFLCVFFLLLLAVLAPRRILVATACLFVLVASSVYIASSGDNSNSKDFANNRSGNIRDPLRGSQKAHK